MTASRMSCFCLLASLNLAYDPKYYITYLKDKSVKLADIYSNGPHHVESNLHCASLCRANCPGYRYRPRDKSCSTWKPKQMHKEQCSSLCSFRMKVGPYCGKPPMLGHSTCTYDGCHSGSVAQYTCVNKFRFCEDSVRSECQCTGKWSQVKSKCRLHSWSSLKRISLDGIKLGRVVKFPCEKINYERVEVVGKMTAMAEYENDGDYKRVIMNTKLDGHWGINQVIPKFPFKLHKIFNLSLSLQKDKFKIHVDETFDIFMERKEDKRPLKVIVAGDVKVFKLSLY